MGTRTSFAAQSWHCLHGRALPPFSTLTRGLIRRRWLWDKQVARPAGVWAAGKRRSGRYANLYAGRGAQTSSLGRERAGLPASRKQVARPPAAGAGAQSPIRSAKLVNATRRAGAIPEAEPRAARRQRSGGLVSPVGGRPGEREA